MEIDRISILQLHSRYKISKSTLYKRIKSLQIIVERKGYVSLIQLQLLDALHQHIEQGGTTKGFINSNPSIKSSSSSLQISDNSGEILSFQSRERIIELIEVLLKNTISANGNRLSCLRELEEACEKGWLLSNEQLFDLLKLSPQILSQYDQQFEEAGFIFTKYRMSEMGGDVWAVQKNINSFNLKNIDIYNLISEGHFRIKQIDEVIESAISQGKKCIDILEFNGSVLGSDIENYLFSAQLITVGMELGGIYRIPGRDDTHVWLGSSGFGVRQLPNRQGYKNNQYAQHDIFDLSKYYWSQTVPLALVFENMKEEIESSLEDIKHNARFPFKEILNNWFQRHQATGKYKLKYGDAYKVYETWVDDYKNEILVINEWVLSVREIWNHFKCLKAITPFLSR